MGTIFVRLLPVFTQQVTTGTQTVTKFTEKLTNFDTVDLGSTETFDQECNICDMYTEKEAVGFCCVCEQYMCYQCCKHHEKITITTITKNHKIIDSVEFCKISEKHVLFNMHLVPSIKGELPNSRCFLCNCSQNRYLLLSFSTSRAKDIFFLSYSICNIHYKSSSQNFELGKLNSDGNYEKIKCTKKNKKGETMTVKFFTEKGSKDICQLTYCDSTVCYKVAFTKSGKCYGVVPFDKGLAISLYIETGFSLPDWQIQYVDFKGNVKRQIYYDQDGKQLFKKLDSLASNETEDILFVSERGDNSVIALDPKGNVIYKFTHDLIKSPTGLTCDEDNNVYVACANKVIQIDKTGEKCRVLLDSKSKNITELFIKSKNITELSYDKQQRRLAVAESTGAVTIFALLPL